MSKPKTSRPGAHLVCCARILRIRLSHHWRYVCTGCGKSWIFHRQSRSVPGGRQ